MKSPESRIPLKIINFKKKNLINCYKSLKKEQIIVYIRYFTISVFSFFAFSKTAILAQKPTYNIHNYSEEYSYYPETSDEITEPSVNGWGYSYSNLINDVAAWSRNPNVTIDTIGQSVQGRNIYAVTVTDNNVQDKKFRVTIHARTHPAEVQSSYVTNEIIKNLISGSEFADALIGSCIFNIIPMINPDGVELGLNRYNANNIDLEGDWNAVQPEAEVITLKKAFQLYMDSPVPIRIALNMHSSILCQRFFVFHDSNGTSVAYTEDEKKFISDIKKYWPDSIRDWNYNVTWTNGTPAYYPESWFWLNYQESVLALTYEDMNCTSAGNYNLTANAILGGIKDFLGIGSTLIPGYNHNSELSIFPNPVRSNASLFIIDKDILKDSYLKITDMNGVEVYSLLCNDVDAKGLIRITLPKLQKGIYILSLINSTHGKYCKIIIN